MSSLRFAVPVLVVALASHASSASAAGDANEASCPAVTVASSGYRSYLPDCRAYELVTPPYKGGWAVVEPSQTTTISPDGSSLIGASYGGFAGAENDEESGSLFGAVYRFSRTPTGWASTALDPPAWQAARSRYVAASADLGRTLWSVYPQARLGEEVVNPRLAQVLDLRETGPDGQERLVEVGPQDAPIVGGELNFRFQGASRDLSHIVFSVEAGAQLWPGDTTSEGGSLYEYVGVHNSEPTLVGIRNSGPPPGGGHVNEGAQLIGECGVELGGGRSTGMFNAISADGSIVYFTALHGECATPAVDELYARIAGSRTVAISEPELPPGELCTGPCALAERGPAAFQGASEDGHKVFFTTVQPLLDGDRDMTVDLYEAEVGAAGIVRLVMVSSGEGPTPGSEAQVAGVARVSRDGTRIYYIARGVLTNRSNANGQTAEAQAFNLYVYDTQSERTSFVANMVTSDEVALAVESECGSEPEAQCEAEVAEGLTTQADAKPNDFHRPFETTGDGRFAIFLSARDLTTDDTSTVSQLFEYDAQSESLMRVSIGQRGSYLCPATAKVQEGYSCDGNTSVSTLAPTIATQAYQQQLPTEAASSLSLTEDGSVFFTSRDALALPASPGSENVYEYRDANVYLISPGVEASPRGRLPEFLGTDATGTDAFLQTTDPLVPQDTDSQADWYDVRAQGGFHEPVVLSSACTGGDCSGVLDTAPLLTGVGGSATVIPEGELKLPSPVHKSRHKTPKRRSPKSKTPRKRRRTGKAGKRRTRRSASHRGKRTSGARRRAG
jgi:hypothetical protein